MELQPLYHDQREASGKIRKIAYLKSPAAKSGAALPAVFWLSGFHSAMTSTKATAIAEWAAREGRACLRFDYSGHGLSSGAAHDGTISDWLDEADAIASRHAGERFIAVGSSMGAWIALLLARRLAGRAEKRRLAGLVLIAPAWDMTEALMWARFPDDIRRQVEENGIYHLPSSYTGGGYPVTKALIEDGRKHLIGNAPFDPGCPVRIVQGMNDADVPWRHALKLVDILGTDDVRLTLVKDGEHRLSREQDLAVLKAMIEEFMPGEGAIK